MRLFGPCRFGRDTPWNQPFINLSSLALRMSPTRTDPAVFFCAARRRNMAASVGDARGTNNSSNVSLVASLAAANRASRVGELAPIHGAAQRLGQHHSRKISTSCSFLKVCQWQAVDAEAVVRPPPAISRRDRIRRRQCASPFPADVTKFPAHRQASTEALGSVSGRRPRRPSPFRQATSCLLVLIGRA
jgi:hypothetical protein